MKATRPYPSDRCLSSAVYEGIVQHRRHAPHPHAFQYRLAQLLLDLDEIEHVFADRWLWSTDQPNLAEFRRSDFFGPAHVPLKDAVRDAVQSATGRRPQGPIRLLTHLRYAGYSFNPVSFYYCYDSDGATLQCILAEVTNTPWRERHSYVLPVASADADGAAWRWQFSKAFHVSPFMPMDREYHWSFTTPAKRLQVKMTVMDGATTEFDATLALKRHPLTAASLRKVLWRYPLMTAQVIGAIHWQALRLWLKGNPVHDRPTISRL